MQDENIQKLQAIVDGSDNIVFFGGAGVSTESGIPDFRSKGGLYNQTFDYPPETILSRSFFNAHPGEFFELYRAISLATNPKPNAAHHKLAQLEKTGKLKAIITQNIDGLHQTAGSQQVLELHGGVHHNTCMRCGKKYAAEYVKNSTGIPLCTCGGTVKPDVVLYEEPLDMDIFSKAQYYIQRANTLIVGGTSLVVYPAAGLVREFKGKNLVVINRDKIPAAMGGLFICGSIGETLAQIMV